MELVTLGVGFVIGVYFGFVSNRGPKVPEPKAETLPRKPLKVVVLADYRDNAG